MLDGHKDKKHSMLVGKQVEVADIICDECIISMQDEVIRSVGLSILERKRYPLAFV